LRFVTRSPAKIKVTYDLFEFRLTQDNIESLKNNLNEIRNPIENFLKKGVDGFVEHPAPIFSWINPSLRKIKI
jgi:hypothetical protein